MAEHFTGKMDIANCYFLGDLSVEAFTCLLVFKNLFSFGLTFKGFDWLIQGNIKIVFMVLGHVQVAICALSIPMCKFNTPFQRL